MGYAELDERQIHSDVNRDLTEQLEDIVDEPEPDAL